MSKSVLVHFFFCISLLFFVRLFCYQHGMAFCHQSFSTLRTLLFPFERDVFSVCWR